MELLATIVLMGIGVLGILGALFTLVKVSDQVHQQSRANLGVHGYAEWLKYPVGAVAYKPCAGVNDYPAFVDLPSGYTAKITKIRTWTGNTDSATRTLEFSDTCTTATDLGLQEITIEVKSGSTLEHPSKETVVLIKRDSRCLVVYDNADGKPC